MAKKKKSLTPEEPSNKFMQHMHKLGFHSLDSYYSWCSTYGFQANFHKGLKEFREEQDHFVFLKKERELYTSIDKNPKKFIEKACNGELDYERINRPFWSELAEAISKSKSQDREGLKELLKMVLKKTKFFMESRTFANLKYFYFQALIKINERRGQWQRELNDWKPDSHNARRQFASLVRHLFCKYDIPAFFDSVWFRSDKCSHKLRDWFIHLGQGGNIRTVKTPINLTKKMAHLMMQAPSEYSIENAIRWGQIHAMGGDKRLVNEIVSTRLGRYFEENDFWVSFINFFIKNPMLDRKHVGPVFDFIYHQKFKEEEIIVGEGRVERRPPPQPTFSMANREPEALLRQVDRWHGILNKIEPAKNLYFRSADIKEFYIIKGKDENEVTFRIKQLLSGRALIEEGKAMSHCVATYATSCFKGYCSIWSLMKEYQGKLERCLTIEVDNKNVIIQARGKRNRLPNSGEMNLLNRWASQNDLALSNYIYIDD